jgi:hypothetical protein
VKNRVLFELRLKNRPSPSTSTGVHRCARCNATVGHGARFCVECGASVAQVSR